MKRTLIIGILSLGSSTFLLSTFKSHNSNNEELIMSNVEALTQKENNPNICYGYELTKCYKEVVILGRKYQEEVGAVCQPTNLAAECIRSWQWGKCQ